MNLNAILLGTLAYTAVTFPLAVVWHVVLFENLYRSFGYFVVFGSIRCTPIQREEWESELEKWLKKESYVTEQSGDIRWYLVKGFAPGIRGWHGNAKYLCKPMGCWGGRSEGWIRWSERNPDIAKDLWPTIIRLARGGQTGVHIAGSLLSSIEKDTTMADYLARKETLLREYRTIHEQEEN